MCDFFKGWRRKTGCVALVMAVTGVGWWCRSLMKDDVLFVRTSAFSVIINSGPIAPRVYFTAVPVRFDKPVDEGDTSLISWPVLLEKCQWWTTKDGESVSGIGYRGNCEFTVIVTPLTLLSTYLLLVKPRPTTPSKTSEPAPAGGP